MKLIRTIAWIAVVAMMVMVGVKFYQSSGTSAEGPGGPFTLTSHTGERVSHSDFPDQYKLIYFGYSYCPDVCRIELHKLTVAMQDLEARGYDTSEMQPLFISVDPERDTVGELADFVLDYHKSLVALTGTPEEIADVAQKFRVYYKKRIQEGIEGYLMDHQSFIYVMEKDGTFNRLFTARDTPKDIADVFAKVLDKKPQQEQESEAS